MCHKPVYVSEKEVEVVDDFVYLGTTIDNKISFKDNAKRIFKKANQRLHLLRKLRSFGVSKKILQTIYKSLVQSIFTYNRLYLSGMEFLIRKTKSCCQEYLRGAVPP